MKEERRSVNTSFWIDPVVEDLSKNATYLFNAMLTFPENNMAGVYEITERKISYYTKMSVEEINEAFRELELKGKVHRVGHWVGIKNHIKNQKVHNGNMAISIVKDLCNSPNEIKLWLFYKPNTRQLEEWFQTIVFKVNSYLREQRNRVIKNELEKNKQLTRQEIESLYPEIVINREQLLRITTEELPFHPSDISNFFNFLTLTKWLGNPSMNRKDELEDRSMKYEEGSMNVEEEIEEPFSSENSTTYQQGRNYSTEFEAIRKKWNSLNLPEYRRSALNVPNFSQIKDEMQYYTYEEIDKALDNYADIKGKRSFAPVYSSLLTFLEKGIGKYADSGRPYENIKETEEEKDKRIVEEYKNKMDEE